MNLDQYQASTLKFLAARTNIENEIEYIDSSLQGGRGDRFISISSTVSGGNYKIVFNLPKVSSSVFVAFTEGDVRGVSRILASLEEYERMNSISLSAGDAIRVSEVTPEDGAIPFAAILLRTASWSDCADVPDSWDILGRATSFFLTVPLSREEYLLRRAKGHDALMDEFEARSKNIFF